MFRQHLITVTGQLGMALVSYCIAYEATTVLPCSLIVADIASSHLLFASRDAAILGYISQHRGLGMSESHALVLILHN
jgi:hypothetical protein